MWENLLPLNLTAAVSVKIKQTKYLWRVATVAIAAVFCEKVSTIHCCENHVQGIDTETGIST